MSPNCLFVFFFQSSTRILTKKNRLYIIHAVFIFIQQNSPEKGCKNLHVTFWREIIASPLTQKTNGLIQQYRNAEKKVKRTYIRIRTRMKLIYASKRLEKINTSMYCISNKFIFLLTEQITVVAEMHVTNPMIISMHKILLANCDLFEPY